MDSGALNYQTLFSSIIRQSRKLRLFDSRTLVRRLHQITHDSSSDWCQFVVCRYNLQLNMTNMILFPILILRFDSESGFDQKVRH